MLPNIHYIVTKASDDETFQVGDHIKMLKTGEILCIEAHGWINQQDVDEAMVGMEYTADDRWIEQERESLIAKLNMLSNLT